MKLKSILNKSILALTLTLLISCGFDSSKKTTESFTSSKIKVENVKIKEDSKFAWAVVGMIRNESSSDIKGYVKIKFLNSSGDIIYTTKAKVNDGDPFGPGRAASFDYFTEPKNFDGVIDFEVVFVEK
ncbi:hypothetical protein [Cellulophaga sp. Z1A5H]|uniref:hypothetical protein n=1 Tax=Cellulophaga sp. Z1A5H TaxID=2687291 RepID=UPI0013FD25AB|nr:hypothetical protein [Cellulophaga sp. Z1A5H]